MTSSSIRRPPHTSDEWQAAFVRHAVEHGGMEPQTAEYESAFAADDQAERMGAYVENWEFPAKVAAEACAFWDRRLLSIDEAESDVDFIFGLGMRLPTSRY